MSGIILLNLTTVLTFIWTNRVPAISILVRLNTFLEMLISDLLILDFKKTSSIFATTLKRASTIHHFRSRRVSSSATATLGHDIKLL